MLKMQVRLILSLLFIILISSCSVAKSKTVGGLIDNGDHYVHTIEHKRESIAVIAMWYTGDLSNWPHILSANPDIDPKKLDIGDKVSIPKDLVSKTDILTEEDVQRLHREARAISLKKSQAKKAIAKKNTNKKKQVTKPKVRKPEDIKVVKKIELEPPKEIEPPVAKVDPPVIPEAKVEPSSFEDIPEAKTENELEVTKEASEEVVVIEQEEAPPVAALPEPEAEEAPVAKAEEPANVPADTDNNVEKAANEPTPEDLERQKLLEELLGE